jgi:hypothetical protein
MSKPPSETIPPHPPAQAAKPVAAGMSFASFDGSFAPLVRPTLRRREPWYKDREYFLGGWSNPSIWKAAVSCVAPPCKKNQNQNQKENTLN